MASMFWENIFDKSKFFIEPLPRIFIFKRQIINWVVVNLFEVNSLTDISLRHLQSFHWGTSSFFRNPNFRNRTFEHIRWNWSMIFSWWRLLTRRRTDYVRICCSLSNCFEVPRTGQMCLQWIPWQNFPMKILLQFLCFQIFLKSYEMQFVDLQFISRDW